jgi:hypothetical protein
LLWRVVVAAGWVVVERVASHGAEAASCWSARPVVLHAWCFGALGAADGRAGARLVEACPLGGLFFLLDRSFAFELTPRRGPARRALVGERGLGREGDQHGKGSRAAVDQGALDAGRYDDGIGRLELLDRAAGAQGAGAFDDDEELVADFLITARFLLVRDQADELGGQAWAVEHGDAHGLGVEEVTRFGE